MVIYIYIYLPVNAIARLPHSRSRDSQGQETIFLITDIFILFINTTLMLCYILLVINILKWYMHCIYYILVSKVYSVLKYLP